MASIKQTKKKPSVKKTQLRNDWMKNVGRSLGMTTTEMLSDIMPASIEFATSTFETVTDVYNDLRDNRVNGKRVLSALNLEDQYNLGVQGLKNALEDIKSGKIYNKERIEKLYSDGDEDFGLTDFEFDEDGFEDSGDETSTQDTSPKVKINASIKDNAGVIASINAQSEIIAQTTEATITANKQNMANTMIFNQRHSSMVMKGFETINDNLGLLINFYSDNMTKYIHASINYYDQSLGHLGATLEEIKKLTFREENPEKKEVKDDWDNVLLGYGGLNVKGYFEMVKKNFNNAVDEDLVLSSMKSFLSDKDTLSYLMASPLSSISSMIVKNLVPGVLQSALSSFDETLSNFFPSLLLKVTSMAERHDGNYVWDLISKIFGVNNNNKNGIDVSTYMKGQIPFDGVTKKAITEVIPTYLKKILAAVSGQQELSYDYDKGVFRKTRDIRDEFKAEQDKRARSGYTDVISEVKTRAGAIEFADKKTEEKFQKGIEEFFSNLGRSNKELNPFKDGIEYFNEIYNFDGDSNLQRFFKRIMMSLDRKTLMKLAKGTIDSRVNLTKYFQDLENSNDLSVQRLVSNGMGIDDHLEFNADGKVTGMKANAFNPVDKFNLSSLDYLRRIENILIKGIRVFPMLTGYQVGGADISLDYDKNHERDQQKLDKSQISSMAPYKEYTENQKMRKMSRGVVIVDDSYDLGEDEDLDSIISTFTQINSEDDAHRENQSDSVFKKMSKYLPGNASTTWNKFSDNIQSLISAPGRMMAGVVEKLDKTLFNMIFGVGNDGQSTSLVNAMISGFNNKLEKVVGFFNEKIFEPLHETLFGEEGWFTRFKQSETFDSMKKYFNKFQDFAFGGLNAEGFREGGLFADSFNYMKDVAQGFKYYFTGKSYKDRNGNVIPEDPNSVFATLKSYGKEAFEMTKDYVFGDREKSDGGEKKPVIDIIKDSLLDGVTNFHKAIFGDKDSTKEEHKEIVTQLATKVKDNAHKTLAWGALGAGAGVLAGTSSLGLMGSIFLPGGPIGGAIVGMGAQLLSQSDTFMNKVFGEKDANNERVGGLISASTQKFLKDNKKIIVGAGVIGALKPALGLGWIPSFILPGGPIGGAMMGIATALTVRSNTFQKLMFGIETDDDGKLSGGLLSSFANKMKAITGSMKDSNILGNMGAGAIGGAGLTLMVSKMGLLGSMLTPFGPMGGAMMGAAAGIALSSEKWRKVVFGDIDEETGKREGGILGKAGNWFELNVLYPMKETFEDVKLNMYEWFGKSIAMPFREALYPIKTEIKYMVEQTQDMFAKGWDVIQNGINNTFTKFVVRPFGEFMEKHVMSKLRSLLGFAFKTSVKALQTSLSIPFKLMGMAGGLAERRQERRGKKDYINNLKEQRKEGNISGLQYVKDRYFNKSAMEDAKTAAKVGNAREMKQAAAEAGMSFADYVGSLKKDARDKYKAELSERFSSGEMSLKEYLNARFFDKRSFEAKEDEALGSNARTEYYAKLDKDRAAFEADLAEKKRQREINSSRKKLVRQLGFDSNYTGFIYEKDKDGNTVADGTKVSIDRVLEALSMNKGKMSEKQLELFGEMGKRSGVKNLLDFYTDNGLNMNDMSKKQRKKFTDALGKGHFNDLLRELNPYTKQEREDAFNKDLAEMTKEYNEVMVNKVDMSLETLESIDRVFKDAYNLLRAKYGLKTKKFKGTGNTEFTTEEKNTLTLNTNDIGDSVANSTSLALVPVLDKLDNVADALESNSLPGNNLPALPMSTVVNEENNENKKDNDEGKGNSLAPSTEVLDSKLTAQGIMEANNKLLAKEKYLEAEEKKKEAIEANQKFASRKTADFVISENNRKKGMKSFLENHLLQSDMLVAINKSMGIVSQGFSWAFGKKGILTALFLTILPLILKWLQDRQDGGPESRYDADGNYINNTGMEKATDVALGKGLGKLAQQLLKSPQASKFAASMSEKYAKWVSGLSEGALKGMGKFTSESFSDTAQSAVAHMMGSSADNLASDVLKITGNGLDNIAKSTVDDIAKVTGANLSQKLLTGQSYVNWGKTASGVADDAAEGFAKYFNTFKYGKTSSGVNKELAEKLGTTASGVINGVSYSVADDAGRVIYEARENGAKKLLRWMKTALDDFATMVLNGVKGAANVSIGIGSLTDDIFKMIDQKTLMTKFGALIGNGGKLTLEVLAKTFTDGVFMTYGAVTGAFEAARLFRVYKQDVDITMAAISAAFKGAMGYKYLFLVEMLNEIIADVTDFDVFSMLATAIYKLISDSEKDMALEQAQLDFSTGVDMYNEANGTNLTVDSYNDMVNEFLSTQIFDQGSAINHRIDENMALIGSKVAKGAVKALIDEGTEGLTKYASKGLKIAGKVVDKLPFGKALRSTASAAGDVGKFVVKSTVEILNEIDLGRMSTFRKLASEAMEKISAAFTKAFPKAGAKFGAMIREVIVKLSDDVLAKFLPKIADSLASKAIGMTAGALTAGVWTAAEFAFGAVSGSTKRGAANLFRVSQDDVDATMRTISSIINGILNVSWFFVIDIINDIYVALTDTDFLSYLAGMMYDAVSSEEKSLQLDNDQIAFENKVKEYNMQNGTSLSVDEYNDEVENASFATKVKNWWQDKKEEKALRKEAKAAGMSVEEYTAYKKKRAKFEDEEVSDLTSIKSSMDSLEEQKEQIIATTDENMYNLRKIVTATMEGLNVTTFEQLAPTLDLSESQLINIRKVIETTMYGIDDETRAQMEPLLGVSGEALDGVYATMQATLTGLDTTTLDKMKPIMDISEEKLENIKWVVEQTMNGMDEATVKNMYETGQITEQQMEDIFTIMNGTLNGMNQETLEKIAPILGISEENLGAVEKLINETMKGINGETEDKLSDLDVADPLRQARANIEDGMALVEDETGNWFTNMVDSVSDWWNNSWIGQKINGGISWVGDKVKDIGGKGGELIEEGYDWAKEQASKGYNLAKDAVGTVVDAHNNNVASHYGVDASEITLGQTVTVDAAEIIQKISKGLLDSEDIVNTVEQIKSTVGTKFTEMKDNVSDKLSNFAEDVGIIAEGSAILVKRAWNGAKDKISEIWDGFTDWTSEKWNNVKETVSTTWGNVKDKVSEIWDGFTEWSSDKWNTVKENVSETWEGVSSKVSETWDGFTGWTSDKWGEIKTNVSQTWEDVKSGVEEKLAPLAEEAKEKYGLIKSGIIDGISKAKDNIKEYLGDPLVKGVKTAMTKLKDGIMAPINWVKDKFSGLKTAVSNGWNSMVNYFQGVIDSEGGYGEVDFGGKGGDNDDPLIDTKKNSKIIAQTSKTFDNMTINNITNNFNGNVKGGFGVYEDPSTMIQSMPMQNLGPGAKIIPIGGGKPISPDKMAGNGDEELNPNAPKMTDGGMGVEPDTMNNFAYYAQTDDRYKNYSYDHSPGQGKSSNPTLGARGCGPTSMAMVATQLTGKKYLPTTLADMARKWGYSVSAGTSWGFFPKAASTFSMSMQNKSASVSGLRSAINSGKPVILSGQRKRYAKEDSPFTTGGHFVVGVGTQGNSKILINDPRGSSYSKAYDINKVVNEAASTWEFKYNEGGSLPTPDGNYTASNTSNNNTASTSTTTTTEEDEALGTWGAFSKMLEAFSIYSNNIFTGKEDRLTFGKTNTSTGSTTSSNTSGGTVGTSFIPQTVQDAILKKTLELTVQHETGGNYTRVKNDVSVSSSGATHEISPSIGIIQMRGNNAKTLMQNMYKKLPNSSEAKYWAEWDWNNNAAWSASQRQRLENYLSSNLSVTKQVQDEHAMEYIKNNNLSQVYKYGVDVGKMSDPRSIVHLGEIGNTGPALIKSFLNKYTKNTSGDEFENYISQFNSKSFWGPKSIYRSRLNSSYQALKNWTPQQMLQGGNGDFIELLGGFGEPTESQADMMVNAMFGDELCKLNDSCGLAGNGPEDNDSVSKETVDKMVNNLMDSVKNRKFGQPTEPMELPKNGNITISQNSQRMIDTAYESAKVPEDNNDIVFDPDLSSLEDFGGKGGEAEEAIASKESSVAPTVVEGNDSTKEIKSLNESVTNMTNKIVAKTPELLANRKDTRTTIVQNNSSDGLLMQIITLLQRIEGNTGSTSTAIRSLSEKELSIILNNEITVEKDEQGNIIAVGNSSTNNVNPMFKTTTQTKTDAKYKNAKDIAKGRIN